MRAATSLAAGRRAETPPCKALCRCLRQCAGCAFLARAALYREQLLVECDRARFAALRVARCFVDPTQRPRLRVASDLDLDAPTADVRTMPTHGSVRRGGAGGFCAEPSFEREARSMSTVTK